MKNSSIKRYISIKDAALCRDVSERTIRRWIASGILPAFRVGPTLIRIDPADLDELDRPIPSARSQASR